jgi:hypothetical protein
MPCLLTEGAFTSTATIGITCCTTFTKSSSFALVLHALNYATRVPPPLPRGRRSCSSSPTRACLASSARPHISSLRLPASVPPGRARENQGCVREREQGLHRGRPRRGVLRLRRWRRFLCRRGASGARTGPVFQLQFL